MTLHIENTQLRDPERLRSLLLDAAENLGGKGSVVLEPRLPWEAQAMLLADADQQPVVVSFDAEQARMALLNGLQLLEQLSAALPWINQVHDALQQKQRPPRLVVVSEDFPPGAREVLASCPSLKLFRYRALQVNGETGLWLERMNPGREQITDTSLPTAVDEAPPAAELAPEESGESALPPLSAEETAYFQQL
ncbi:MAG TPA: hypothetical protein ENK05_07450 [Gammaproteobacteria bacterium]|nr:hypothetical protein [Gammaproteobacteria bacterium]